MITALAVTLMCLQPGALAASINYTSGPVGGFAGLHGSIKLEKLGSVAIPRGRMTFRGNTVELTTIPEWQFDREVVLSGLVLKTSVQVSGQESVIKGIAYFQDGSWLQYVDNQGVDDSVVTADGTTVGKIESVSETAITLKLANGERRQIAHSAITEFYSPRAYNFSMPATAAAPIAAGQSFAAESTGLTLKPTEKIYHLAALKADPGLQSDGDWSTKKLVLIGTVLTAMQTAQFIPILCVALREGHMSRRAAKQIFQTQTQPSITPTNILPLGF